eukprot:gnl/TRDRNA2_/TRDRNA2_54253_c0_seq1.p1 gnl/TRDRNA2_/TRDRNA2_54253_c0~~gnl/TRDRNA2_/TRDRNA2_54253_c0_seq1.p1  ORF type:complete len:511 (-),score=93.23 gnl/TRDRNA2_/TRDRNA2_54253_c0_seq1:35-1567(-)
MAPVAAEAANQAAAADAVTDEANRFLISCSMLAAVGMGIQSFNGNFTAPTLVEQRYCDEAEGRQALNCALKLSEDAISVYAAIPFLASMAGAILGGAFVDRIGRKKMMLVACVPYALGWIATALTPSPSNDELDEHGMAKLWSPTVLLLFSGRISYGLGGGLSIPGIGPWITEAAPVNIRGAFGTLFQVLAVSGIGFMYVLGLVLHWRGIAIVAEIICLLYGVLLLLLLPESPRWLLAQGRDTEALAALSVLRTRATDSSAVLAEMKAELGAAQRAENGGIKALWRAGFATRYALLLSMLLMTLQNLSGVNAVFLFLGELLQPVFHSPDAANLATLPVAVGLVGCTLLAASLMDRLGRAPLLLTSTLGMASSAAVIAVYFRLQNASLGWMALVAVISYFAFFSLGVGPIPWLLASEMFPPAVRGTANSIATMTMFSGSFLTTYLLQKMRRWLGLDGLFAFYAVCCGIFALTAKCLVVETKGKNVEQILCDLCPRHAEAGGSAHLTLVAIA